MRIKLLYKRAFDVAMLITAHVILAPLWIMLWIGIPLAILIESGMPVFYRQERMGKGGKPFWRSSSAQWYEMLIPSGRLGPPLMTLV